MNTRMYPRTLEQAFGPYTSREITEPKDPNAYGWAWWAAMVVVAVITLTLVWVLR